MPFGTTAAQTSLRNFAFARSGGTFFAATPKDDNQGFSVFVSGNFGASWTFFQDVTIANAYTFYPAMVGDDHGRIALSFQVFGEFPNHSLSVTTWLAALPAGATAFVGPTPISGQYLADAPPPQGSCIHSLCEWGAAMQGSCDPLGCVADICQTLPSCCSPTGAWTSDCAYLVGNLPDACQNVYSCGGRVLGDFATVAAIPTGDIPGFAGTFMPTWSQRDYTSGPPVTLQSTVAAALVQVSP